MKLLYTLTDKEFPYDGINHVRDISRGVIYNDKYEIGLLYLDNDIDTKFGPRHYFETPGGGIEENETPLEAFIREVGEEIGAEIDNIEEIGIVEDDYNAIKRHNVNHYYLGHLTRLHETHLLPYEKSFGIKTVWIPLDEVVETFNNVKDTPISRLVRNRELPIIKIAVEMIKSKIK